VFDRQRIRGGISQRTGVEDLDTVSARRGAVWRKELLAHRRDTYGGPSAPVFPSRTGTPLNPNNVRNRVLGPAAIEAGLYVEVEGTDGKARKRSTVGFHSFRHTCASLLFDAGRNVKQVQEWLGHADPAFTLRTYVHLMDEGVGDAEFLDEAIRVEDTAALKL